MTVPTNKNSGGPKQVTVVAQTKGDATTSVGVDKVNPAIASSFQRRERRLFSALVSHPLALGRSILALTSWRTRRRGSSSFSLDIPTRGCSIFPEVGITPSNGWGVYVYVMSRCTHLRGG
jgi:hypothetical protein